MPKTVQAAVIADEIVFELERFEVEGDRLELSGRWFGVRGRRFFRPTLIPVGARERSRMLADLDHKPWAAEDGEPWQAAFVLGPTGSGGRFELSVAPDISIQLPSPGSRPGRSRRITAAPRRPTIGTAWRQPEPERSEQGEVQAPTVVPPEVELEAVRAELQGVRAELEATTTDLEATRHECSERGAELEAALAELRAAADARVDAASAAAEALAERDRAAAEGQQWRSEHDHVISEFDELTQEGEALRSALALLEQQRDQLAADLALAQRTVTGLRSELQGARAEIDQAARRRDEAITAHGAALVMRRAARAEPHYERPPQWWRPAVAVLALIAVVFAILIVAHVL